MKDNEIRLIAELLKNSKKSDRELGRILGLSQATVSRTRTKLEKDGVIQEYSILPDFSKLGFELFAITTGWFKVPRDEKLQERARAWMSKYPNVILSSRATGMGKDAVLVSLHRTFADYENFMVELKSGWSDYVEDIESILINLKGFMAKPFSLKYLAEILNPSKATVQKEIKSK
jgi:DNA-binding Lrp family transcriptional regulator